MGDPVTELDVLDRFVHYADRLDQIMGARARPAYSETCVCGASVEVGVDVPARERSRLTNYFVSRHSQCAYSRAPETDEETPDEH